MAASDVGLRVVKSVPLRELAGKKDLLSEMRNRVPSAKVSIQGDPSS